MGMDGRVGLVEGAWGQGKVFVRNTKYFACFPITLPFLLDAASTPAWHTGQRWAEGGRRGKKDRQVAENRAMCGAGYLPV